MKPMGILFESKRLCKPKWVAFDKGDGQQFCNGDGIRVRWDFVSITLHLQSKICSQGPATAHTQFP